MAAAWLLVGSWLFGQPNLLDEGIALYEARELPAALQALTKALDPKAPPRQRARVHLYIGLIQYRYNIIADARASFDAALDLDPRIKFPDPSLPAARKLFNELKRADKKKKKRDELPEPADDPPEPDPDPPPPPAVDPPPPPPLPRVTPPPPPPPAPPPLVPPPASDPPVGGWIAAGTGGAALVVATVFVAMSMASANAAEDAEFAAESKRLYDRAVTQRTVSLVSFGTAAAAGGVAALLFVLD